MNGPPCRVAPETRGFGWSRLKREDGLSLAELLVAISIFGILTTLAFTAVINGSNNLKTVRQGTDLNEEARLALNRMSRELRQASGNPSAIALPPGVTNPDITNANGSARTCPADPTPCFNPASPVAVAFDVDFTDNGINDPERVAYEYRPGDKRLYVTTAAGTAPLVSGNVTAFKLSYRSSQYKCDANSDGQVTWQELETAPSPCPQNRSANTIPDLELPLIDQIIIDMTVGSGKRAQTYRTKIDLRNQEVALQ